MTRLLLSVAVAFAAADSVHAQPGRGDGGRGPFIPAKDTNFDLFRALLHFHGVKPLDEDDLVRLRARDYRDVIVVVLGRNGGDYAPIARNAISNGGAVLVACEDATDLSSFLPGAQPRTVTTANQSVTVPDPEGCYFQNRSFPYVAHVRTDGFRPAPEDRLFAPLPSDPDTPLRVVTNVPSCLVVNRLPVAASKVVAEWPLNSRVGGIAAVGIRWPFAMAGSGGERNPYRALLMADPDVLSNAMLYSSGVPDPRGNLPHNWAFANRLVTDFLRDGHPRERCLFVENGRIRTDFDRVELKAIQSMPNIPPIPIPNPLDRRVQAKMAELIDQGLATLEDRTVADNLLSGPANDPAQRRYQWTLTVLTAAAGLALVSLMVRRLFAARHRQNFVPAPTDPLFLGDTTALGSFGQRRAELLRGSDFRAPVRFRIRELFADRGLPADFPRRRLPPLDFRSQRERAELQPLILDLWDVAARDEALPLPYSEWKDWELILAEVHAAAVADRWRFAPTPAQGPA